MIWTTSWDEIPCGSLPCSDELIAAKIGAPPAFFQTYRGILMRGWWRASDDRYYHDVIAALVLDRLEWKRAEAERKAKYRMSHGTDAGRTRDSTVCDDTGAESGAGAGAGAESDSGSGKTPTSKALRPPRAKKPPKEVAPTTAAWSAYATAYFGRYGAEPVRNATVNGQLANFVARVGGAEAPAIAAHYLRSENVRYVRGGHSVGLMLHDAEKLRTEWATGKSGSAVADVFDQLRAKARAQEESR